MIGFTFTVVPFFLFRLLGDSVTHMASIDPFKCNVMAMLREILEKLGCGRLHQPSDLHGDVRYPLLPVTGIDPFKSDVISMLREVIARLGSVRYREPQLPPPVPVQDIPLCRHPCYPSQRSSRKRSRREFIEDSFTMTTEEQSQLSQIGPQEGHRVVARVSSDRFVISRISAVRSTGWVELQSVRSTGVTALRFSAIYQINTDLALRFEMAVADV